MAGLFISGLAKPGPITEFVASDLNALRTTALCSPKGQLRINLGTARNPQ
jgi:hypothetical protein